MDFRILLVALTVFSSSLSVATAQSLPSPDDLRAAAGKDSELMEQYRDILRDPDPNVRLSAFTKLARVESPIYRHMAYDEAFASGDHTLRALALKYSLFDRSDIIIHYPGSEIAPEKFDLKKFNLTNGDFEVYRGGYTWSGRVQGLSVHISFRSECAVDFTLNDDDVLTGLLKCNKKQQKAVIDLRGN